jgi:HK97 family phage major capsid protein
MSKIMEAINKVAESFEMLKKTQDEQLAEERKGNEARAAELGRTLEKISADLQANVKARDEATRRQATLADRLEILEALNDRPGKTAQDKIRSEHKELMVQWLRSGGQDQECEKKARELSLKAREMKDVVVGQNLHGGFAVPEEISREVDKLLLKTSEIVANVKSVNVSTPDYKELISINGVTYNWSSETGTRSATLNPTLRECAVTHGELYAYVSASNWSLQDMFFNVESWLVENLVEGFAKGLDAAVFNGNGSSRPTGMTNTAVSSSDDYASPMRSAAAYQYEYIRTAGSSPFTTAGITADSIINLVYKLNPRYRGGAKFAANTVTQGHIRKLKGSDNNYLWQPGLQMGQPDRLMGYEVFTWEDLGAPTTANALPVAFGDFKKGYTLALIQGMQIIRDQVSVPGYTKFYVSRRFGGIPTNNDAVKFLKVALS